MGETAASLELLKGSKKEAVEKELSPAADAPVMEEIELDVDIDSLDDAAVDEMVEKYSVEVPAEWPSMTLDDKKSWLQSQSDDEAPAAPAPEPKKPVKAEKKSKAKPKKDEKAEDASVVKGSLEASEAVVSFPQLTPEPEAVPLQPVEAEKPQKKKSQALVKSETLNGEIVDEDLIVDIVQDVETMNEQDARKTVAALSENTEKTFFKLGGVLSVILKNKWYAPYGHFRDLVENEYGIHYRRAMYWISIYDNLVESKVPWSKVKEIGWAKLKELADIITVDNVDDWVQIAKSQPQLKFMETVKAAKTSNQPAITDQSTPASTTTNKTFKVHSGQKETIEAAINKAKEESNTTVDTVALENICLDYLGGESLTKRIQKLGLDKALELVSKAFPDATLNIEVQE